MSAPLLLTIARGEEPRFVFTQYQSQPLPLQPLPPVEDITGWTIQVSCYNPDGSLQFQKAAVVILGPAGTYEWDLYYADTDITPKARPIEIWRIDTNFRVQMGAGVLIVTPSAVAAYPITLQMSTEGVHVTESLSVARY